MTKLTGCTMSCSEGHTYEYGCLLDRCGDPAPATVTFDLPTPDTRAAFLRNTKAAIEAACPDITVVFYGKAPKYVEEQWTPDAAIDEVNRRTTVNPDSPAAREGRNLRLQTPNQPSGCSCPVNNRDHTVMCDYCAWRGEQLRMALDAGVDRDEALRRIAAVQDVLWPTDAEEGARTGDTAGHHPACQDPSPDGAYGCLGCFEAEQDEAGNEALRDAARRRREMLAHPSPTVQSEAPQGCSCDVNGPNMCDYCTAYVESRRLWEATPAADEQDPPGGAPPCADPKTPPCRQGEPTPADHHPACDGDRAVIPADCLECAEAAEDEADFARRHGETLDYTDFYAVPTAGDYYAARKRAACHRECGANPMDCPGMVNGKCMAPTTEKENDADAGTGILATVRRGARAFRRGVAALFTATGGPGGGIPG